MSAFPPSFDSENLPTVVASVMKPAKQAPRRDDDPKRSSWWFVFEKWVSVPSSEDEYVLA